MNKAKVLSHNSSIKEIHNKNPQKKSPTVNSMINEPFVQKEPLISAQTLYVWPRVKREVIPVYKRRQFSRLRTILPVMEEGSRVQKNLKKKQQQVGGQRKGRIGFASLAVKSSNIFDLKQKSKNQSNFSVSDK